MQDLRLLELPLWRHDLMVNPHECGGEQHRHGLYEHDDSDGEQYRRLIVHAYEDDGERLLLKHEHSQQRAS